MNLPSIKSGASIGLLWRDMLSLPRHVHLLVNEPGRSTLANAVKALKLSVSLRRNVRPFWQSHYYDFNVFTNKKRIEKLRYIHGNPVARGLVEKPDDWSWSSFRHYATGMDGTVEIESFWTRKLGRGNTGIVLPGPQVRGTWGTRPIEEEDDEAPITTGGPAILHGEETTPPCPT